MKNESDNIKFLRIPLYSLLYAKDINDSKLYDAVLYSLTKKNNYTKEELDSIKKAIKWAIDNRDYDFKSIMPDIEHLSNEEIYSYLNKVFTGIELEK